MSRTLQITLIGNSTCIVLPRDILDRLRVAEGDHLFVNETLHGIELTSYDPAFAAQMEVAEEVMREDRQTLHDLSRS